MVEENKAAEEIKTFGDVKNKVEDIIDNFINKEFAPRTYDPHEAQRLSNDASEEIIKQVQQALGDGVELKFTATIIILQKADAGFHMSASCFWDQKSDGNYNKKYEFKDFYVICNFFAVSR